MGREVWGYLLLINLNTYVRNITIKNIPPLIFKFSILMYIPKNLLLSYSQLYIRKATNLYTWNKLPPNGESLSHRFYYMKENSSLRVYFTSIILYLLKKVNTFKVYLYTPNSPQKVVQSPLILNVGVYN